MVQVDHDWRLNFFLSAANMLPQNTNNSLTNTEMLRLQNNWHSGTTEMQSQQYLISK